MASENASYWLCFSPSISSWHFVFQSTWSLVTPLRMEFHSLFLALAPKQYQSVYFCYISFGQMFHTIVSSSMACLCAYSPNVPSNVYERRWFCSCKCNVLINPPSKTSSCQAVSIIWSECQLAPILCSLIPAECRTGILAWRKVFCLVEMSKPYVLWHQYMYLNVIFIALVDGV